MDDNEAVRLTLCKILQKHGFEVTCPADVIEVLRFISVQAFDFLLSGLYIPGPADRVTGVSAMRHKHTDAVTLLLSAAVQKEEVLTKVALSLEDRRQHLPQVCLDLAKCLHAFKPLGINELKSESANRHGLDRKQQGIRRRRW